MPINVTRAILLLLMVYLTPVNSAMYKCKTADGSTTYSDKPCPGAQKIGEAKSSVRNSSGCEKVRFPAQAIAEKMRKGIPSNQVIREAGGVNSLDSFSLDIISYVYAFRNAEVSSFRIGQLAEARCRSRGGQEIHDSMVLRIDSPRSGDIIPCSLENLRHRRSSSITVFEGSVDNSSAKWIHLKVFDRADRGRFLGTARGQVENGMFDAYLHDAIVSDPKVEHHCEL